MLAISVEKPHSLAVVEASSPAPEQSEVRVRVRRAGICGSDVHILHGSNPFARYPRIIGHEFAGEIESVGPDVSALAVGAIACRARRRNGTSASALRQG